MAVTVDDGRVNNARGHALVVYDERNPAFRHGGQGELQFNNMKAELTQPDLLRRVSWQRLLSQLPTEFAWLKSELGLKYGLVARSA